MKIVEKASKALVIWFLLSLLLKCSVLAFDVLSVTKKVDYVQANTAFEIERGSKV